MRDPAQPRPIGPVHLEDFRSAQRRHRRSARVRGIPAVLAAGAMGIPFGVYLSPVLMALAIVVSDLVNLAVPMADVGGVVSGFLDRLLEGDPGMLQSIVLILIVWLVPGVVLLVVAYFLVRWRLGALDGTGIALGMGGRDARLDDPEEFQFVNVVTELALAADIHTPAILLYDDGPANALVFGRGHDQSTVVIARRLLNDLDREQTQGVVARLLASADDGDLELAVDVAAVYVTYGLVSTLIASLVSGTARRRLRAGLPPLLGRHSDERRAAAGVAALLGMTTDDDMPQNAASGCLTLLTMGGVMTIGVSLINLFLSGPLLTFAWRSRVYLADATAVDLTRNPEALARALRSLNESGTGVPGCGWLELLLVVGGAQAKSSAAGGVATLSDSGFATSLSPPVSARLARLRALGASDEVPVATGRARLGARAADVRRRGGLPMLLGIAIIVPLGILIGVLLLVALALIVWLSALAAFIVLAIVAGPIHELLRGLAGR